MFLIDFARRGNVIEFFFGNDSTYWGDDWDDRPYEHNAGNVYEEYVRHVLTFAFPLDYDVMEPGDDWHYNGNSPFSKEDFKNRRTPCLIITKEDNTFRDTYSEYLADLSENVLSLYFGTDMSEVCNKLIALGGVQIADRHYEEA